MHLTKFSNDFSYFFALFAALEHCKMQNCTRKNCNTPHTACGGGGDSDGDGDDSDGDNSAARKAHTKWGIQIVTNAAQALANCAKPTAQTEQRTK